MWACHLWLVSLLQLSLVLRHQLRSLHMDLSMSLIQPFMASSKFHLQLQPLQLCSKQVQHSSKQLHKCKHAWLLGHQALLHLAPHPHLHETQHSHQSC